ncbi:MAG TPA: acyltransferase [Ohtaekwangia sp.]|nr:acyltransferase [Ohtaekwangia sp.]
MQKRDFLTYIHYFRGLAILFIVGLHVCVMLNWGERQFERKILIVLFNNGTVLFVFIAGFLFFYLYQNRFEYLDYLKKKFLYVIIPYLIVSIPALIDKFYFDKVGDHWWMDEFFSTQSSPIKVFQLLITGRHMGVFWFIPMISIIYLAAPLIIRFSKTQAFLYIVPVLAFLALYTFRFGYFANIGLSLIYFFPVYLFGIWACRVREFFFTHATVIIVASSLIYVGISMAEIFEWVPFSETIGLRDAKYTVYRFNFNKFKIYMFAIGVLVFLYRYRSVQLPFLKLMGDYSFGIFFVHLYVLQVFRLLNRAGYLKIAEPNIFMFFIYFAFIIGLTTLIIKMIKITFKQNSRYVIGS